MAYLHKSVFQSHGYLSSATCHVDNRWVLKISGFALHAFRMNTYRQEVHKRFLLLFFSVYADLYWPIQFSFQVNNIGYLKYNLHYAFRPSSSLPVRMKRTLLLGKSMFYAHTPQVAYVSNSIRWEIQSYVFRSFLKDGISSRLVR